MNINTKSRQPASWSGCDAYDALYCFVSLSVTLCDAFLHGFLAKRYIPFFTPFSKQRCTPLIHQMATLTSPLIPICNLNGNPQMREKGHRSNAIRIVFKSIESDT